MHLVNLGTEFSFASGLNTGDSLIEVESVLRDSHFKVRMSDIELNLGVCEVHGLDGVLIFVDEHEEDEGSGGK